jgi:phosphoglycolate phosphatase
MSIRGLLFDKDGTLIDFNATWLPFARLLALDAAGGHRERAEIFMRKLGFDPAIGGFLPGSAMAAGSNRDVMGVLYPDVPERVLKEKTTLSDRAAAAHASKYAEPVPGVVEAVRALQARGYRMAVATNDAEFGGRKGMEAIGLGDAFEAVFGYDSVANPKPAPDMVLAFARHARLEPREIAVIGDNTHDLHMAHAAGAGLAIGVLSGNGTSDVLEPLADVVLTGVAELPAFLTRYAQTKTAPEGAVR